MTLSEDAYGQNYHNNTAKQLTIRLTLRSYQTDTAACDNTAKNCDTETDTANASQLLLPQGHHRFTAAAFSVA